MERCRYTRRDRFKEKNSMKNLSVDIGRLVIKNPVLTASGTFGYGQEFDRYLDLSSLGAIIVKGLSIEPSKGNPPPRIVETACGMLNAIGLENVGVTVFIEEKLPFLSSFDVPVIANIYGRSLKEYAAVARELDGVDAVAGIELNISCPNVKAGGVAFGVDPDQAAKVTKTVRLETGKPLMVKLSPNVTDIVTIATAVEAAGADAISLINTITGMAVDLCTRKPKLANITGGLSGPAIKPIALRMVWQVAQKVAIPIIGIGGIMTAEDALEFLIAGATAVQVGTANFINPGATAEIIEGIAAYLDEQPVDRIGEIIGTVDVS